MNGGASLDVDKIYFREALASKLARPATHNSQQNNNLGCTQNTLKSNKSKKTNVLFRLVLNMSCREDLFAFMLYKTLF